MNFEKLAGEIGFDKEDYPELIEVFINTTTSDIDKLKVAINNGDFNAAENAAHSMIRKAVLLIPPPNKNKFLSKKAAIRW